MFSWKTKKNMALATLFRNRPFYVQYYILSQCNLNCRMCNIVEGNSDLIAADLKTVEKIARNLSKIGAGVVLLSGGEPFLHKDLPEIIRIFVDHGLSPRLQTAGFQTSRKQLEACFDAGARDINISLDSLVPEKQTYINGSVDGSWERAIETIVVANEVFSDPDRICAFGSVLSRLNYMEIPALVELATYLGWYVSMVPVHITSLDQPMNFRGVDETFRFKLPDDEPKLRDLERDLMSMKADGYNLFDSEKYLESTFYFLRNNSPNWRKNGVCDSPNLYFAVLPNGDWAVCCDHRYQGRLSVAADDFPEIYRSREFRKKVFQVTSTCSGCNFGSYPEVTLSVRNWSAFWSRAKIVFFSKRKTIPHRSLAEVYEFIGHLRDKYAIPPYDGPSFSVKPGSYSQRYGEPELITRGARETPRKYREDALTAVAGGEPPP